MELSKERIEEFKKIFKEDYGKDLTDEEAHESASNLVGFFSILYDIYVDELKRKNRLKKEPNGFPLEGDYYSCPICGRHTPGEEMWYDKHGQKCIICQKAIDDKIIPGSLCDDRDSFYRMWELKYKLDIHSMTAKKMVREGKLNARIILNKDDKPHEYIFLIQDNPGVLPVKNSTI